MKLLHKLPVPFLRIWNHHSDSEKNSLPGYISPEQLIFLKKIRHHRQFVFTARILLLILFLLQWELCANAGIVDSFIFSSPSRIARCFWEMTLDQSIFLHIGITLYETLASFACVTLFSLLVAVLLWSSRKLSEILEPYLVVLNSPAEICPGSSAHCMARCYSYNHYRCRNVGGSLRKYPESLHSFHHRR